MNWPDERYVRLYVRDTVTWKRWTWEARALLGLLLRKVDRSGVLETGRGNKAEALALMLEVPLEVAGRALDQWISSDTITETPTALVLPSFIEAQEASQSDRQRQADSRGRRRAAVLKTQPSEFTDAPVTSSHTVSQPVTPAVPYRAVPAVNTMSGKPDAVGAGREQLVLEPDLQEKAPTTDVALEEKLTDDEFQVFEHWRTKRRPRAKASPERKRIIAKALKLYSVADLQRAIDGVAKSPHHMGDNDRHTVYDDIELILRDAKRIEGFIALAEGRAA